MLQATIQPTALIERRYFESICLYVESEGILNLYVEYEFVEM
jgi:hypothetical protein